ncbi:NAD+ synthase [Stetteria hydrogenophila]
MRVTIEDLAGIDYSRVEEYLAGFLKSYLEASGARGYVLGLSGGVDSAAAAALAARAVGRERVTALVMPDTSVTPREDVDDALGVAEMLGIESVLVEIDGIVEAFRSALPFYESPEADRLPLGNARARIRMAILYYYANKYNYLVLGTGDRSEVLIGYFTKYGDGAADVAPLSVLYKSQVRRLALHLGIPRGVALKPSSPRLWPGHLAEEELGLSYEEVDLVLHAHLDRGIPAERVPEVTGVPRGKVEAVLSMVERSRHKREPPAAPPLGPILELMGVRRAGGQGVR